MLDGELVDESKTHLLASIGTFCVFVKIISNGKEQEKSISELMSRFGNNTSISSWRCCVHRKSKSQNHPQCVL